MGAGGSDCKSASCNCQEAITGKNGEGFAKVSAKRTCCYQEEEVEETLTTPQYTRGKTSVVLQTSSRGEGLPLHFNFLKGSLFGLAVVDVTDLLVVTEVDPKGAFVYTAEGNAGLFPGDVIQSVNGVSANAVSMRDQLSHIATCGGIMDLLIRTRPSIFDVELQREGDLWNRLGISVKLDASHKPPKMIVQHVRSEGLVPSWNEKHAALRICRCDCITAVNGVKRNLEDMQASLQGGHEGECLALRIETPFREPGFFQSVLTPRSKSTLSLSSSRSPRASRTSRASRPSMHASPSTPSSRSPANRTFSAFST